MSRGTPIEILTEAADTQHTAALTWQECYQILAHFDYLDGKLKRAEADALQCAANELAESDEDIYDRGRDRFASEWIGDRARRVRDGA